MKKKGSMGSSTESTPKSLGDKIRRVFSLITIEPSLLVHMIASFMGNLLLKNLQLYKACHVNLEYPEDLCENFVAKTLKNRLGISLSFYLGCI